MDSRFIPASIPAGTKRITAEQAQLIHDADIELMIYWYRGHDLKWGQLYDRIAKKEIERITHGEHLCINQQDYWQLFGYDVVFPALDATKDNHLEFFGNKLTVRFDPDFWGDGNAPMPNWAVLLPLGDKSHRGLFDEFSSTDSNTKAFVLDYFTQIAAKAMPDFKFNFQFQS
jgi:hypothetical protein